MFFLRSLAVMRSLAVCLLLCLSAQPACAFNVNWPERVQRFSGYVERHAIAQGQRTRALEMQAQSFQRRVQGYVRVLEAQTRSFQASPAAGRN